MSNAKPGLIFGDRKAEIGYGNLITTNRVWVGIHGEKRLVTEQLLRKHFSNIGEIKSIRLDETEQHQAQKYAVIEYETVELATNAVNSMRYKDLGI